MPLPVVAGVPWLAGIVSAFFVSLFTWFTQFFTRRLAIVAAGIAVIVTLTTGFTVAIDGLISGLIVSAPSVITNGAGLVLPSNFSSCMGAMVTGRLLRYAYEWNVKFVQLKLF